MFKQIEGYEYEVSEMGEVRNMKTGRILKPGKHRQGYSQVNLFKEKKQIMFKVHRLVAMTFLENSNQYPDVDHKNNIKSDNRVENLQWCSHSQNRQNTPLRKDNISGVKGVYKLKDKYKAHITIDGIRIHIGTYETIEEARDARIAKVREVFTNAHITEQGNTV
jgi:hypothetical protein